MKVQLINRCEIHLSRLVTLVILVLITGSCRTYKEIDFQVLKPAVVTIPSDVRTIAFVDRNLHYRMDTLNQYYRYSGDLIKDSIRYDSLFKRHSFLGLSKDIHDVFQLDTIPFITLEYRDLSDSIRTFPKLSWSKVDSICELNQSDILVVMEGAQVNTEFHGIADYGYVDIKYWALFRIYDPLYQLIQDEFLMRDSLQTEANPFDHKEVGGQLPTRREIVQDMGYRVGLEYLDRISPNWANEKRRYFYSGDKRMDMAYTKVKAKEWKQAITIWKTIAKDDSKEYKLAGKAAHNLALAYEVEGDLKQANQWIRKSIYFFKQLKKEPKELQTSKFYALALMERINDERKLKEFFGE